MKLELNEILVYLISLLGIIITNVITINKSLRAASKEKKKNFVDSTF